MIGENTAQFDIPKPLQEVGVLCAIGALAALCF
jgi:hypothetical protein